MSISRRMKYVRFEMHTRHTNEFHHTSVLIHTYLGNRVYTFRSLHRHFDWNWKLEGKKKQSHIYCFWALFDRIVRILIKLVDVPDLGRCASNVKCVARKIRRTNWHLSLLLIKWFDIEHNFLRNFRSASCEGNDKITNSELSSTINRLVFSLVAFNGLLFVFRFVFSPSVHTTRLHTWVNEREREHDTFSLIDVDGAPTTYASRIFIN